MEANSRNGQRKIQLNIEKDEIIKRKKDRAKHLILARVDTIRVEPRSITHSLSGIIVSLRCHSRFLWLFFTSKEKNSKERT